MKIMKVLEMLRIIVALGLALTAAATPARQLASYTNPVFDENFPDPAVLSAPDGFYYAYATQGEVEGRMLNIQVARSRDLVRWERAGDALPVKPSWASQTQDFWAPDVSHRDGRYHLYYSAKPDAALSDPKQGLCLAVATAARPEGPFVDSGQPLLCGQSFINIDPFAFDDPATGKRLLYWGSGFAPIKVRELAPDRISFAPASSAIDVLPVIPGDDPDNYQRLVEGAWVVPHNGYYYLFYSGDNCCGPKAHYAVMVARSRSATGPFEMLADTTGARDSVILEKSRHWLAPGHNSVITDAAGEHWLLYHAVDTRRPRNKPGDEINSRRIMLIDKLVWQSGWPRVERRSPSSTRKLAPVSSTRPK